MIIDVHTHPPRPQFARPAGQAITNAAWRPDKAASISATAADYAQAMEVVDRSITFNIAAHPDKDPNAPFDPSDLAMPTKQANDITAEFVRSQGGKVIGFLTVHPYETDPMKEIDRGVHELGMRGVKLGLNYQRADLLGWEAFAIYDRAQKLGLPVLFHMGTSPVRTAPLIDAYPLHVDRIAIAFPDLKIIMAHIGHPWQIDTIVVIRKHPNVYADISAQFFRPWSMYNALRLATEWGVLPKLLFGSDYPIATPAETM
ncbi:MAG: amidohydrolase, partial [Chloroflexi bacterium]|nr:amidohydrolase [Chloroflexota bacterium]